MKTMRVVARGGLIALIVAMLCWGSVRADDTWIVTGADGRPQVQLYFYWSLNCPHCTDAHPHVSAIPAKRDWVRLHELELSREPANVLRYQAMAEALHEQAVSVPALIFCGEMHVGWDSDGTTGVLIRERLDACRARLLAGAPTQSAARKPESIELPLLGAIDPARLSLPAMTLVLAALDAFNPCAMFVLLFLLSMMAHQSSRSRMLLIGGVFVLISGLMYFAFMAAWLSVFQLFGHLAWVTVTAGLLAVFVGALNLKDFFVFKAGLSLSIPDSKKPQLFRRARSILAAEHLPSMLAATALLAVAANFYELLCTAGFPMVFTRLLTLAEPSLAARYLYLAAYNLIYILPLAAIVAVFARTLGSRKLSEREGRQLKLMSGVMMLELGALLLIAPQWLSSIGIAFGLLATALLITWIADRFAHR